MVRFEVRQFGINGLETLFRTDLGVVVPGFQVERVRDGRGVFPIRFAISPCFQR